MISSGLWPLLRLLNRARLLLWRLTGTQPRGAHAIAVSPAGRIVLVKLTYSKGWRLPGGASRRDEDAEATVLRELCEEIGMEDHGEVACLGPLSGDASPDSHAGWLFLVRDVAYRARPSLEVAEVGEFPPDALPCDVSPSAARWIGKARHLL